MPASRRRYVLHSVLGLLGAAAVLAPLLLSSAAEERAKSHAAEKKGWQTVAPGRVEPWSGEIRIGSPAIGRVAEVMVNVNDTVFPGEAMIRLEDDEARTRHAKAELQQTLRRRARPKSTDAKVLDRRKFEDAAFDAERSVVDARAAVDRAAAARRAGKGADDDVAAARKALTAAREQMQVRRDELAKFEADGATTPTELEGQHALSRIDLRGAEAALDNLNIRAPIAGTVLQVNIRAGELASPSALLPLIVLGDVSKLRVRAEVDERDYGAVKAGMTVTIRSSAFRDRDVTGTVSSIAPIVEPGRIGARGQSKQTDVNVVEVVVDVPEPGPLAVGMKVDVYFHRDGGK